jgi:hypothetical protein
MCFTNYIPFALFSQSVTRFRTICVILRHIGTNLRTNYVQLRQTMAKMAFDPKCEHFQTMCTLLDLRFPKSKHMIVCNRHIYYAQASEWSNQLFVVCVSVGGCGI